MAPRTRPVTAGVIAAAASITSSSDIGSSTSFTSFASNRHPKNSAFLNKVPRGGSISKEQCASSASTAEGANTKQYKKKKRRSKSDKRDNSHGNAEEEGSIDDTQSDETESVLPAEIQHILSQSCHYSVLGLPKSASQTDILKAYRKKCVLTHPDKLPKHVEDRRGAFDKVSNAYDVLSCEKKRAMYDKFGHADENEMYNMGGMGTMFGQDVFKDFFGGSAFFTESFSRRQTGQGGSNPFRRPPRNKDLRYNLEVTLEDLYKGTTKHVAIQQPNPLQPHLPLRKELEVHLTPGMMSGNSVRISGVVDSIPNCAPADVVFLLSERRHPVFTRRGSDLAMEMKISLGESVGGFQREVRCLDGKTVVIGPPKGETVEMRKNNRNSGEAVALTLANNTESDDIKNVTKDETETIQLPPAIIKTGDIHVLKGKGMPSSSGTQQYGNLYIQYVVEMPGSQSSKHSSSLSSEERIELARLLHKLEGKKSHCLTADNSTVQYLEPALASDFGKSHPAENRYDGHLHDDSSEQQDFHTNGINDFFERAFTGRTSFGNFGSTGGFQYFSSGRGGFGYRHGHEEDQNVECNQM